MESKLNISFIYCVSLLLYFFNNSLIYLLQTVKNLNRFLGMSDMHIRNHLQISTSHYVNNLRS